MKMPNLFTDCQYLWKRWLQCRSLQTRLLHINILLVGLMALGISIAYYELTSADKKQQSQERLHIAFKIMQDDFQHRLQRYPEQVAGFLQSDTLIKWLLSSYNTNPNQFFSFLTISRTLVSTTTQLKQFAPTIMVDRLLVYGGDMRLLVAYYRQDQQEHTGGFLRAADGQDTYVTLDNLAQLMRDLAKNATLPEAPLPAGMPGYYTQPVPAALTVKFFKEGRQLGLRVVAPIETSKQTAGVLQCDIFLTQEDVARYASLSSTDINFFAGQQWSIGTLPTQPMFTAEDLARFDVCRDWFAGARAIHSRLITMDKQPYYQGQCAITDGEERLGFITVSLSQMTEQRQIRNILFAVLAIAGVVSSLAVLLSQVFSRRIILAFHELNTAIARVARGDIPEPLTREYTGEFNQTKDNLNLLIAAANETTQAAEAIAAGQLSIDVRERSAHDRLMQALNRMIRRLDAILKETDALMHAICNGQLDARGNGDAFAGGWREMITRMNNVIDTYAETSMLNSRLKEENLRMSAELDVSRRIQQMLLPSPEELQNITGMEIVGFMQPADEVGGDYYDVLHHEGVLHIGIGDVTGHGLESGLIMLMTQAAIRTLIEHGETDPVKFVNTLNRLIYKNVERMRADKNLTFALVQYQHGQIKLVGQHEELLVVRQGGQVERVDTINLGFLVGLEPEIADWVHTMNVTLNPGDGLVLYTDGITEAENAAKQYYGLERLCAVISQHWHLPAEAIKRAVVNDVMAHIGQHKVYDDITLVVMKQH